MEKTNPIRNPDIVTRKEESEALLFNPADGNILCVNGTGIFIWDHCDGAHAPADMAGEMSKKYDVTEEKAKEDCLKYLKELEGSGFIGYAE